jgi:hypothetical protein
MAGRADGKRELSEVCFHFSRFGGFRGNSKAPLVAHLLANRCPS